MTRWDGALIQKKERLFSLVESKGPVNKLEPNTPSSAVQRNKIQIGEMYKGFLKLVFLFWKIHLSDIAIKRKT